MNLRSAAAAVATASALLAACSGARDAASEPSLRAVDATSAPADRAAENAVWRELREFRAGFGPADPAFFDADNLLLRPGTVAVLAAMGSAAVEGLVQLLRERDPVFATLGAANFAAVVRELQCNRVVEPLLRPDPTAMTAPWQSFAAAARRELALAEPELRPR